MPYLLENGPYNRGRTHYGKGDWGDNGLDGYAWRRETIKPNTTKRVKPSDLFLNGTSRGTTLIEQSDSWCVLQKNDLLTKFGMLGSLAAAGIEKSTDVSYGVIDSKLIKAIRDENLNLAQGVAEYGQVSSMFGNAAQGIVGAFRGLRSGHAFSDVVRWLKKPKGKKQLDFANKWLEIQYGWKPLISDLFGLADALCSKIQGGLVIFKEVHHSETFRFYRRHLDTRGFGNWIDRDETHEWRLKGKARYIIREPKLKTLTQIGVTNPALLAWELIPYSFVIDWLIPVGDHLAAMDSLNGVSQLVVQKGHKQVKTHQVTGCGGVGVYKVTDRIRAAPTTTLQMPRLSYQPSQSLTAIGNGLALLTQLQHGFKR